jgi:hypothetical protein
MTLTSRAVHAAHRRELGDVVADQRVEIAGEVAVRRVVLAACARRQPRSESRSIDDIIMRTARD